MTIGILQPDSGNIRSVCDALGRLGRPFELLPKPELAGIKQLLIPGQGRFGPVMAYLKRTGWDRALAEWVAQGRPLLGICVGMQVLFEGSEEDPDQPGLGFLKGRVSRLPAAKLPMIGWAHMRWRREGFPQGAAYFVNSFAVAHSPHWLAKVNHGHDFCAAVRHGSITAFQCHPEKSGNFGKGLLDLCLIC